MRTLHCGLLTVFLCVLSPLGAQEPRLSAEKNPSDATGFVVVKYRLDKGDDVQWEVSPKPTLTKTYVADGYSYLIFNGPPEKTYTVTADWINWDAKKRGRPTLDVVIGKAPQPPPTPGPGPNPPIPDPPTPQPSGPLRVIFVYESGGLLTGNQQAVMFGVKVRDYLDTNAKGWRRYDKDVDTVNEKDADLKALWSEAKAKVTTVPCVVVASGTRAEILPLPNDPDAAVELFKKYKGN